MRIFQNVLKLIAQSFISNKSLAHEILQIDLKQCADPCYLFKSDAETAPDFFKVFDLLVSIRVSKMMLHERCNIASQHKNTCKHAAKHCKTQQNSSNSYAILSKLLLHICYLFRQTLHLKSCQDQHF